MTDSVTGKPSVGVATMSADQSLEDRILVAGCRKGDPDSLKKLMEIYGSRIVSLLRNIVSDPQTAEALAQEAFFKAFRSMDKFKDGTNLRVWLLTISKNTALDHLRKKKRSQIKAVDLAEVPEPVESRVGPTAELMKKEEGIRVREALEELPSRERDVVSLRVFETLTWDAISEVLGIPEATARARMNRALQRLRTAMG